MWTCTNSDQHPWPPSDLLFADLLDSRDWRRRDQLIRCRWTARTQWLAKSSISDIITEQPESIRRVQIPAKADYTNDTLRCLLQWLRHVELIYIYSTDVDVEIFAIALLFMLSSEMLVSGTDKHFWGYPVLFGNKKMSPPDQFYRPLQWPGKSVSPLCVCLCVMNNNFRTKWLLTYVFVMLVHLDPVKFDGQVIQVHRPFVLCGQGSSPLWIPLYRSNAPAQGEEGNW